MTKNLCKPQTKQQLAHAYGVSLRTITTWLEPFEEIIGEKLGRTYTPKQVQIIYKHLGSPLLVNEEADRDDQQ